MTRQLGELAEGRLRPAPQLAHDRHRRLAGRGQAHAAAGALEELDPEVGLEPSDLLADRRGGDVPLARRRPDRTRPRHRQQGLERGKEGGIDHEADLSIRRETIYGATRYSTGAASRRSGARTERP